NVPGKRRLGKIQLPRCLGEIEMLGYGEEAF
ncbi:MAG: hypothetical protein QOE55_8277, partial [Acidobacteriaceae bacterium]|nr:hypothetical protein [Acidobacteriaceae bacterium]